MKCILEETVENAWSDVNALEPEAIYQEMMEFGADQTELVSFVNVACEELTPDAQELASYLAFVVYRVFKKAFEQSLPTISPELIMEKYDRNQQMLAGMEERSDEEFEEVAALESAHQPYILQYVTEVLFETDEEDEGDDQPFRRRSLWTDPLKDPT